MAKLILTLIGLFGFCAQANQPTCFGDTKEIAIPTTKYTLSNRGEVLNAGIKFANLPLPKGFFGECIVVLPIKNDVLAILSMGAKDYDEKNAFVFRISGKEAKILWSQLIPQPVRPYPPFVNDKVLLVPTIGQVLSLNPETGSIRWKFSSKETEGVDFKKMSLNLTTLIAEGSKINQGETVTSKFEINVNDGKLVPVKK